MMTGAPLLLLALLRSARPTHVPLLLLTMLRSARPSRTLLLLLSLLRYARPSHCFPCCALHAPLTRPPFRCFACYDLVSGS